MTSDCRVQCPRVGLEDKSRTHQLGVYVPLRALFLVGISFCRMSSMFHMTFVQIAEFDWLLGQQNGYFLLK